jgi:hypothetical protein
MLNQVWEALGANAWDDEALREVERILAARNPVAAYPAAMAFDRAQFNSYFEPLVPERDIEKLVGPARNKLERKDRWRSRRLRWWRDFQLALNRAYDEQIACYHPETQTWDRTASEQMEAGTRSEFSENSFLPAALPSFSYQLLFHQATLRLAEIACVLERFKRARGGYPQKLEELVPDFTARLPLDPCGGGAFRYRCDAPGSYLLYSVGLDGRDDGGSAGDQREPNRGCPDWRWWPPEPLPR